MTHPTHHLYFGDIHNHCAVGPVVEIMSMHGAAESPEAPRAYLHTMGPRDWESTYHCHLG